MKKILIIGATSAIAQAVAQRYAAKGATLYLLARNEEKLEAFAKDLKVRGATQVQYALFDADDTSGHETVLNQAIAALDGFDICLVAYGTLSDHKACEASAALMQQAMHTNAVSVMSLLTHLGNYCAAQQSGTLAVISSVAGDRGRQSNYVYGAAKGALSIFLQGLRNRLFHSGVHVLTIKPGFVDTPMTAHLPKSAMWASPDQVAKGIEKAIAGKRNTAYIPGWWLIIMLIIRSIPEAVFKRLKM